MYEMDQHNLNEDNVSVSASVPSNIIKNMQLRVKTDRFYSIKRALNSKWIDGKYYKNVTINMYGSGNTGSFIRNAVTGERRNHRVGSADEYLYFSVAMCNGLDKLNGPVHLFYDTPSQYEKHQYVLLDPEITEKWYQRYNSIKGK
jgi:hypothetical protein